MVNKLRILIVEDNPADTELITEQLSDEGFSFEYKNVFKESDFRKELENFKPDVILSDYALPQFDGKEALLIAREKYPLIPFIIVSGFLEDDSAIQILKEGAVDYLLKANISRLGSAVKNALSLKKATEEKMHAEEALRKSYRELEQRVEQRTVELAKANESLRAHQIELEMQNEELVRTKADLESVKDNYLDLYDFAPTGYFTLDVHGIIHNANLTGSKMLGIERKGMLSRRFQLFIVPDDREMFAAFLKKSFLEGCIQKGEIRLLRKDGSTFFGQLECVVTKEKAGDVCRIMVMDISDRKKLEHALIENEMRLRRLYESGLFGVFYWNIDGKITDANDKFLDMVRFSRDDLAAGRIDWLAMTPPEYRYIDELSRAELISTGINKVPYEKQYIRKGGTRIPIIIAGATLDQTRYKGVAFVLDITDRKQAERDLRESEQRYRRLFETMNEGFCLGEIILDEKGKPYDVRYLMVNPAFERQRELKAADILGKTTLELFPQLEPIWFERYGKVVLSGEPAQFEERFGPLDRWFQVNAFRTGPTTFACLFTDITDKKKAEELLQRDKETLEKLVNERTESLLNTHRELDRARRLADIGRLSSTIAHELRNPLAAIQLAMHNVQRKAQNTVIEKHLKTVSKKILESDQIIQNLLSFSRVKTSKIEKLDICELIRDCMDTVSIKYVNWNVELRKNVECTAGDFIEADYMQFKMLISNILDNAYQAMRDKKGVITVSVKKHDEYTWEISIADTGTGIDEHEIEKIFDPFYTTKSKGTGLGLAISREIVDMHRGKIEIQSNKGVGSTFIVTLPIHHDVVQPLLKV
ncbi:MAG: PAS domain S-box protein [Endomicrobiales bacterium]